MRSVKAASISFSILCLVALCNFGLGQDVAADEATDSVIGARFPSISPGGETIAFTCLGDIWTVPVEGGRATRLTVHSKFDGRSSWSPDGKWLAFSSNREYNTDIFVMPSSGGVPTRLTFHGGRDGLYSWAPDGKSILFYSRREFNTPVSAGSIFAVSPDGGLPTRLIDCSGSYGVLSPDGRTLAFVRGSIPWWRRGYRGSADREIWLKSLDGTPALQFTDFEGTDTDPMWSPDGSELYFLSDREGVTNVWVRPIDGGEARMVSNFATDGLIHAYIALNGSKIVCELDGEIYAVDPETGEHHKVPIHAPSDLKHNQVELKTFSRKASEFALSPNGKEIAFVVRGEIFAMKSSKAKRWIRLTETAAREDGIAWGPKGKKLAFCSDRNGNRDIFVMRSSDAKEKQLSRSRHRKVTSLAATDEAEYAPVWSPDGKKVAYLTGRGDLWVMDSKGKNNKLLAEGPFIGDVSWGPKGAWLVFRKMCSGWQSDIFIVSDDGGEQHNITKNPAWDHNPRLSKDGKKIVFLSNRSSMWQRSGQHDVWHVFLTKKDEEQYLARRDGDVEEKATKKSKKDRKAAAKRKTKKKFWDFLRRKKKPEKKEKRDLQIDFEDIHLRAMKVSRTQGSASALSVSPDGKTYAFGSDAFGKSDVYLVDEFGKKSKRLTSSELNPEQILWGPKSKEMFILNRGGAITKASVSGITKPVPFVAKMKIDHKAERLQMFNEAWRAIETHFYDKELHGVDWAAVKAKYLPLLETVATQEEFVILLSQMVGELRASHTAVWPPRDPNYEETGQLGLRFDAKWKGRGLRVSKVVPDGPSNLPGSEIAVGDVILSMDGVQVDRMSNPFGLLKGKVDEMVDLEVLRGGRGKPRLITVKAWSWRNISDKVYLAWVESRKALVSKFSDGKVGYTHIRSMSRRSYKEFLRDLTHEMDDKEALIVDVRYNGGGNLHDQLLSVLGRDVYFYFEDRDKAMKVMQPRFTWRKPVAVLINEFSHSDAEVFPYSFRELGIGKLIGVPTSGGVIFVSGGVRLLDGTFCMVPQWGAYTLEGKELEGVGVKPDIHVENPPEQDFSMTSDDQLKTAVEELLREVE